MPLLEDSWEREVTGPPLGLDTTLKTARPPAARDRSSGRWTETMDLSPSAGTTTRVSSGTEGRRASRRAPHHTRRVTDSVNRTIARWYVALSGFGNRTLWR